jgi:hypothetical protein
VRAVASFATRVAGTLVLGALLWLTVAPASAIVLGDAEVHSAFSQRLLLRIPYQLARGESIEPACVRLLPMSTAPAELPVIRDARASLQTRAGRNYIVLESPRSFNEPAARLNLEVRCGSIASRRNFVLLFDPPEWFVPAAAAATGGSADGAGAAPPVIAARPAVKSTPQPARATARPVLRVEPAHDDGKSAGRAGEICCFRLAYELAERRDAPPLTAEQRDALRRELRERLADENPGERLHALRQEVAALKAQAAASGAALAAAQARNAQQTRDAASMQEQMLIALCALIVAAVAIVLWQRRRLARQPGAPVADNPGLAIAAGIATPAAPAAAAADAETANPEPLDWDLSKDIFAIKPRAVASSSLPTDSQTKAQHAADYENAYVQARFPEVAAGTIGLGNPASVINGACVFYFEEKNPTKTEELLRIAIARHPAHIGVWLALFEVLYLENMAEAFAELAWRYRETHNTAGDPHWPMVVRMGQKLDPESAMFGLADTPPEDEPRPHWLDAATAMADNAQSGAPQADTTAR